MNSSRAYHDDPITALATPWGESAVAVIRTSGAGSVELIAACFSRSSALRKAASHAMVHGMLIDPDDGREIDEVLCAVFLDGRGYTGEESVEIHAHGSLPGIQLILELLRKAGFRDAQPGEFTQRAFLNGRMDLTQAEAVAEIVSSKSRAAHTMALHRLGGGIRERINAAKEELKILLGAVEIQLDYPEDEVPATELIDPVRISALGEDLHRLTESFTVGRLYNEGARIALSGRTNAGKSSLFNLFVREDRSIVSEVHGTTRDFVHEKVTIQGIPVTLYDTAGLREAASGDAVEEEGIRRSGLVTGEADLVLYLVDGSQGIAREELNGLDREQTLLVWSKADISAAAPPEGFLAVSSSSGEGFPELEKAIRDRLLGRAPGDDAAVIDSVRQRDLLIRAQQALGEVETGLAADMPLDALAVDLRDALDSLGEITGEVTTTEVLNDMFSRFCVGK